MANYFETLNALDVSGKTEKKNGLTYLSWAFAWGELKKRHPASYFTIYENEHGWPYFTDGRTCWVKTGVTVVLEDGTALEHMEQLKLSGGLLRVEGKAVAFSVVSIINPLVADIHYEKCLPRYRDAYPLINRETAKMLPTKYINREEDLNIEGLRKAKLSYNPAFLVEKYWARLWEEEDET